MRRRSSSAKGSSSNNTGVTPVASRCVAASSRRRTGRILALLEEVGTGQCVLCVPREDEIPAQFTRLERWRVRDGAFARVET